MCSVLVFVSVDGGEDGCIQYIRYFLYCVAPKQRDMILIGRVFAVGVREVGAVPGLLSYWEVGGCRT